MFFIQIDHRGSVACKIDQNLIVLSLTPAHQPFSPRPHTAHHNFCRVNTVLVKRSTTLPDNEMFHLARTNIPHKILHIAIPQCRRSLYGNAVLICKREYLLRRIEIGRKCLIHISRFAKWKNRLTHCQMSLWVSRRQNEIIINRIVQILNIRKIGHPIFLCPCKARFLANTRTSRHLKSPMLQFISERTQIHICVKIIQIEIVKTDAFQAANSFQNRISRSPQPQPFILFRGRITCFHPLNQQIHHSFFNLRILQWLFLFCILFQII